MTHINLRGVLAIAGIMAACYAIYLGIVLGFMALMGWWC